MLKFFKSIFSGNDASKIDENLKTNTVIIDVRMPVEFKNGHYKGALNIPLDQISKQIESIIAHNKSIIVCCESGMRSRQARSILVSKGINEVYDAGGWRNLKNG